MTYSPGDDSAIAVTRPFAASRACAASTKQGLPSPRNLRMQKGRPNQTPSGQSYRGAVGPLSHESVLETGVTQKPHFHFDRAIRFNSSVISLMLASKRNYVREFRISE